MEPRSREHYLKIAVGAVVGLFLLDRVLLTPALASWKKQGEHIGTLREQVTRGRQLLAHEKEIRAKWEKMQGSDLSAENSIAEDESWKGWSKWATASRVTVNSITPNPRSVDETYTLLEFRASTTGSQSSLGQLIYAMETDPLPVRLEDCELTARDPKGQQVTGALRFSLIRLKEGGTAR